VLNINVGKKLETSIFGLMVRGDIYCVYNLSLQFWFHALSKFMEVTKISMQRKKAWKCQCDGKGLDNTT